MAAFEPSRPGFRSPPGRMRVSPMMAIRWGATGKGHGELDDTQNASTRPTPVGRALRLWVNPAGGLWSAIRSRQRDGDTGRETPPRWGHPLYSGHLQGEYGPCELHRSRPGRPLYTADD